MTHFVIDKHTEQLNKKHSREQDPREGGRWGPINDKREAKRKIRPREVLNHEEFKNEERVGKHYSMIMSRELTINTLRLLSIHQQEPHSLQQDVAVRTFLQDMTHPRLRQQPFP